MLEYFDCPDDAYDRPGDPQAIEANWPGLKASQIERYYVDHGKMPMRKLRRPAYLGDENPHDDPWQLVDFLHKLNLRFPIEARTLKSLRQRLRTSFAYFFSDIGTTVLSRAVRRRFLAHVKQEFSFASPEDIEEAFADYPSSEWQALAIIIKSVVPFVSAHNPNDINIMWAIQKLQEKADSEELHKYYESEGLK